MKQLKDLLDRLERDSKFVTVTCPVCKNPWDRHGAVLPPNFDGICPVCYDNGARPGNFRRAENNRPVGRKAFLVAAGFPSELAGETFRERPGERGEPMRSALAWQGEQWCLGLVGGSGVGKTMIAGEICWRLRAKFPKQRFIRADEFVSAFYGRLGKNAAEIVYQQTTTAQLLILDDLGWGNRGGAMDAVFEVLAKRHGDGGRTIWTSNREPEDLATVNAPMLRRLMEGRMIGFDERHEWQRS